MYDLDKKRIRLRDLIPSLEIIEFQKDGFGRQLEIILKDIVDKALVPNADLKALASGPETKLLINAIYKRFGINSEFNYIDPFMVASVYPFPMSDRNILSNEYVRQNYEKIAKHTGYDIVTEFENKKGYIDTKNAKVSGIFSKYKHRINLDLVILVEQLKLTVKEITGLLLHELGHVFTYYEFSDRLTSTNQVLQQLAVEVNGTNDPKKKSYIFKNSGLDPQLKEDMESITNESNRVILGYKIARLIADVVRSELDDRKYDETSSEQLADNFAARMGYGREIIISLEKIHGHYSPEKNNAVFMMLELSNIMNFVFTILFFFGAIPAVFAIARYIITMMYISGRFYYSGEINRDMTYDDLKIRYKRIRDQYIQQLKTMDFTSKELTDILANISGMDKIIDETHVRRGLFSKIANYLFTKNRKVANDVALQQLMEELAHNDLFIKSAEFQDLHNQLTGS